MSNRLDPITQSAITNASELGLVLTELNNMDIMSIEAQAHRLRAEAHAELWRKIGRGIARLFGRTATPAQTTAPAVPATDDQTVANDNADRLAA